MCPSLSAHRLQLNFQVCRPARSSRGPSSSHRHRPLCRSTTRAAGGGTVPGSSWRHPRGPDSNVDALADHPVVHIAYDDALAYAAWAKKRLPTEAEWEFAARGGIDRAEYVWGNEAMPSGSHAANTFQGHFPSNNSADDGYVATAPVKAFPANGYGLYGMSGNVWEWVADWYRPDYYATLSSGSETTVDPRGPTCERRPWRTRRAQTSPEGRLIPLHRRILRSLPARCARQRRAVEQRKPSRLPPGEGPGTVSYMAGASRLRNVSMLRVARIVVIAGLLFAPASLALAQQPSAQQVSPQERTPTASVQALPQIPGAKPRNVVFILADDHRYDAMGFMGHPFLETPNMDRARACGRHLRNAFVTTALCSPSRASILTGRYAHQHRVVDNNTPMPPGTVFFPQYLQQRRL